MNKELWLMRHAKAERFDGIEDYDRVLKKRGKRAARRIGEWLKESRLRPDVIISSPAVRAYKTAAIVCSELEMNSEDIIQDKRLYEEGMVRMKSAIIECPEHYQKIFLVGHNPELEMLLRYLVDPAQLPEVDKLIPTAALVRLGVNMDWKDLAPHNAQLLSLIYPKSLMEEDNEN